MRNTYSGIMKKAGLVVTVFIVMLCLCGCRTRITNNDAASNVMYDEDGYMSDTYDMRRDELSLSKAKEPLFKGFGGPAEEEEEYEYYDDEQMLEEYDPAEYEEPYEEPEEEVQHQRTTPSNKKTGRTIARRRSGRKSGSGSSTKPSETKPEETKPDESEITVSFDAGDGTCDIESIIVKSGEPYGSLPEPAPPGEEGQYVFAGWNTAKDGSGDTVTSETKVTATAAHTLYAQYTEAQPEPEPEPAVAYTVTFDANGEGAEYTTGEEPAPMGIEENGSYGALPTLKRPGYLFDGWFTAAEGGDKVSEGDAFKPTEGQTEYKLYAHWSEDPDYYYKSWTENVDTTVRTKYEKDENKPTYRLTGTDGDKGAEFLEGCGMKEGAEDAYDYLVVFGEEKDLEGMEIPEGSRVLLIPKDALKSSTNDNAKLMYRIKTVDKVSGDLYGEENSFYRDKVQQAASELGLQDGDIGDIVIK